jgi:hypothetical protein
MGLSPVTGWHDWLLCNLSLLIIIDVEDIQQPIFGCSKATAAWPGIKLSH